MPVPDVLIVAYVNIHHMPHSRSTRIISQTRAVLEQFQGDGVDTLVIPREMGLTEIRALPIKAMREGNFLCEIDPEVLEPINRILQGANDE